MNTVHEFNDMRLRIQKSRYKRRTGRKIQRSNRFIREEFTARLCQLFQNIENLFVHFHLLLRSFKTT
jgi:hypothetical protein